MKKLFLIISLSIFLASCGHHSDLKRPKLVVGIVVDQMRYDFLYRYWDKYSEGGFKRLVNKGFSCEHTMIGYVPTYTGPGHAAIYTGCDPAVNGIVANDWIEVSKNKKMYCVKDPSVAPIGIDGSRTEGSMSPKNLYTTTITDQLRFSNNFQSKVIGISLKDRGAILPAGQTGQAYWFEGITGKFITSNYYSDSLPGWLRRFNDKKLAEKYLSKNWDTLTTKGSYSESTADDMDFEDLFPKEKKPVFPHELPKYKGDSVDALRTTPFGNTILFDLAKETLEGEKLGKRNVTDFLCVSFSSTDYVGHRYGPDSKEVEDTYLRLDEELAQFFDYLDQKYGKDNVLIFLTADHGAAQNPKYLSSKNVPAGAFAIDKMEDTVNSYLYSKCDTSIAECLTAKTSFRKTKANYDINKVKFDKVKGKFDSAKIKYENTDPKFLAVKAQFDIAKARLDSVKAFYDTTKLASYINLQVYLKKKFVEKYKFNAKDLESDIVSLCAKMPGVASVISASDLMKGHWDGINGMIQRGYNKARSGNVIMTLMPGWFEGKAKGTTHGGPYPYDTHIPLVWYGWHIKPGSTNAEVGITDITPTLAALLHIQMPDGANGKPIKELLKEKKNAQTED